ncbi:MAG: hypothetical protein V8S08_04540 [Lachnoclostridium sp.]
MFGECGGKCTEGNESIILNNTQTIDHLTDYMNLLEAELMKNHRINPNLYVEYDVKRGLRDSPEKVYSPD